MPIQQFVQPTIIPASQVPSALSVARITPTGLLAAITAAGIYTDQQNATTLVEAATYTDQQVAAARAYIDEQVTEISPSLSFDTVDGQELARTGTAFSDLMRTKWRMQTNTDPDHFEFRFIDIRLSAGSSDSVSDMLAGPGALGYVCSGGLFMLGCYKASDGADLGHVFGHIAMGSTLYATTTATQASRGSAAAPSLGLANDGWLATAHASFETRISGIGVIFYQ